MYVYKQPLQKHFITLYNQQFIEVYHLYFNNFILLRPENLYVISARHNELPEDDISNVETCSSMLFVIVAFDIIVQLLVKFVHTGWKVFLPFRPKLLPSSSVSHVSFLILFSYFLFMSVLRLVFSVAQFLPACPSTELLPFCSANTKSQWLFRPNLLRSNYIIFLSMKTQSVSCLWSLATVYQLTELFYNIKPDCQLGILQTNLQIFSSFVQYLKY